MHSPTHSFLHSFNPQIIPNRGIHPSMQRYASIHPNLPSIFIHSSISQVFTTSFSKITHFSDVHSPRVSIISSVPRIPIMPSFSCNLLFPFPSTCLLHSSSCSLYCPRKHCTSAL